MYSFLLQFPVSSSIRSRSPCGCYCYNEAPKCVKRSAFSSQVGRPAAPTAIKEQLTRSEASLLAWTTARRSLAEDYESTSYNSSRNMRGENWGGSIPNAIELCKASNGLLFQCHACCCYIEL